MPTEKVQTVVVGSGVIGLAVAGKLAAAGHEVLVLEAEASGHCHTSARNSQVIHSGFLYPPGSLKAKLCVAGRRQLYDFCASRHVDHVKYEKLVIATDADQVAGLRGLCDTAIANGVHDLEFLCGAQARTLEPELRCHAAVLSPSTGVIDVSAFMHALEAEAVSHGAVFAYHSPVQSVCTMGDGFTLQIADPDRTRIACTNLVNAAGVGAWDVARGVQGDDMMWLPPMTLVKACYFSLSSAKSQFERLIYPVSGSTGVHALRDVHGAARFGPTTEFLDPPRISYRHDRAADELESGIRTFWPDLPKYALQPDICGIRPRITLPGAPLADFLIAGPRVHAIPRLVHLFGIESPGLTSSLAIADHVLDELAAA